MERPTSLALASPSYQRLNTNKNLVLSNELIKVELPP